MFEKGEKTGNGERLSRKRARQIGENDKNAVNAGMGETPEELAESFEYASSDSFGPDLDILKEEETARAAMDWFSDDPKMQEKIRQKLEEKQARRAQERAWNSYIGGALAAKENEIGSMVSDEEREAERKLAEAEADETKNKIFSPEWRAEKVGHVWEKVRGNKTFIRMERRLVGAMITLTFLPTFLAACGNSDDITRGVHPVSGNEFLSDKLMNRDDNEEVEGAPEAVEEEMTEEAEAVRSLDEILELSKSCNVLEFSREELELAGNDPKLVEQFESSEKSRVLENGLQLNYENGYYSPEKQKGNKFGPSQNEIWDLKEGRTEAFIDSLMESVFSQPQELAAQVAELDMVLLAAGVDEDVFAVEGTLARAQAVYDQMLNREDGGALQARLRGALKIALLNDKTTFTFYRENRIEKTFYLKPADPNTQDSPETNLALDINTLQRKNAKQVQAVFHYGDISEYVEEYDFLSKLDRYKKVDFTDYKELLDLNADCCWQPCFDEQENPKPEITEETENVVIDEPVKTVTRTETSKVITSTTEEPKKEEESDPEVPETPNEDSEKTDEPDEPEESDDPETPDDSPDTDEPEDEPEEEEPDDEPDDEVEEAKPKDEEGEKLVVNEGAQSNPVDQTSNVDDLSNQGIVQPSNGEYTEGNSGDGQSSEGQDANAGGQGAGNAQGNGNQISKDEITGDLTGTYEQTEESVIEKGNEERTEDEQVVVPGTSDEEKQEAEAAQEAAKDQENIDNMSDEEFLKFLEEFMKGL